MKCGVVIGTVVLAACGGGDGNNPGGGGGDCNQPGSMGELTFTYSGMQFKEACFDGSYIGSDHIDMGSPNPLSGHSAVVMGVRLDATDYDTNQPCNWGTNVTKPLTSGCLTIFGRHSMNNDGNITFDWTVIAGFAYLSEYPGAPTVTGSLTVTAWPSGAGDTFLIELSPDATFLYPSGDMGNTGPNMLVPVSGMAGMTTGTF